MDDSKWFEDHLQELRNKFNGKLVAVLNGKIILVGDELEVMAKEIHKMKEAGKIKGVPFIGKAAENTTAVHIPHVYIE